MELELEILLSVFIRQTLMIFPAEIFLKTEFRSVERIMWSLKSLPKETFYRLPPGSLRTLSYDSLLTPLAKSQRTNKKFLELPSKIFLQVSFQIPQNMGKISFIIYGIPEYLSLSTEYLNVFFGQQKTWRSSIFSVGLRRASMELELGIFYGR